MTGAPVYDQWFARRPARRARSSARKVGLRSGRPFLLYLCSSHSSRPTKSISSRSGCSAVRSAPDPRVREVGILIRPHRENTQPWQRFDDDDVRERRRCGRAAAPTRSTGSEERLLRFDVSLGRRGRHQHQRADRGGHRRPSGVLGAIGRVRRHAGRHAAFPLPAAAADGGLLHEAGVARRARRAADEGARSHRRGRRRLRRFVEAFVRPDGLDRAGDAASWPTRSRTSDGSGKRPPPRATRGQLAHARRCCIPWPSC